MDDKIESAHGLALLVECEGCKMKFHVAACGSAESIGCIQHKKEYKVKGRSIFLTYYDCPSCGRRHFVQIDDNHTLEILKMNRRMFTNLAVKLTNGKTIPKSQSDKYKKQTKHLRNCRIELMKEFTGVMLHDDETDTSFELRFSI